MTSRLSPLIQDEFRKSELRFNDIWMMPRGGKRSKPRCRLSPENCCERARRPGIAQQIAEHTWEAITTRQLHELPWVLLAAQSTVKNHLKKHLF